MAGQCRAFYRRSSRILALLFGWVGSLSAASWSSLAHAYEDQASLDLALGGTLTANAESLGVAGSEFAAGGALGVSDLFLLRAQLGYLALFDSGKPQHTGRARVEAAYLIDVLKVVPFFGLGADLWLYRSQVDDSWRARPGGHLLLGVDYLWSRTWTLGADLRFGLVIEPGHVASANEVQLRLSRMFDLF